MLVVDVGNNDTNLNTGNHIAFQVNYMGLLSLMNSRYIERSCCECQFVFLKIPD